MLPKMTYDQHLLLHKYFPGDCHLCRAEAEIRKLKYKLKFLETVPDEEEINSIISSLTSLVLWEAINNEGVEGVKAYIARLSKAIAKRIKEGKMYEHRADGF